MLHGGVAYICFNPQCYMRNNKAIDASYRETGRVCLYGRVYTCRLSLVQDNLLTASYHACYTLQFGMDCEVLMTRGDNSFVCATARQLLPFGFEPAHLRAPKQAGFVTPDSAVGLATSPVLC